MLDRAALLAALASAFLVAGCASPSTDGDGVPAPPPPEVETDLDLEVDTIATVRGGVRLTARMTDGSADVSVVLGDTCHKDEAVRARLDVPIGRGFATSSRLVWSFTADELAAAYPCDLLVRARGFDRELGRVRRTAKLEVSLGISANAMEHADDGAPVLDAQEFEDDELRLGFKRTRDDTRLVAGHFIVGPTTEDDVARFRIPISAVALAAVSRGWIELTGGFRFATSLRIGSASLDDSEEATAGEGDEGDRVSVDEAASEGEASGEEGDEGGYEGDRASSYDDYEYVD